MDCGCGGTGYLGSGRWSVVGGGRDGGWLPPVCWVGWLAGGSRAASQMTGVCRQEGADKGGQQEMHHGFPGLAALSRRGQADTAGRDTDWAMPANSPVSRGAAECLDSGRRPYTPVTPSEFRSSPSSLGMKPVAGVAILEAW